MVFIAIPNGVNQQHWWPTGTGKDFQLAATMEPLAALKSEIQVIAGLDHANAEAGPDGAGDHARASASLLTGCRAKKTSGADIHLGTGPHVHCVGKGRKERSTPLLATTVAVMHTWLSERNGQPADPLFATTTGRPLSRDAIERRVHLATTRAQAACPSLAAKQVTAHTLRHTAAMRLLHAGVDVTVIARGVTAKAVALGAACAKLIV